MTTSLPIILKGATPMVYTEATLQGAWQNYDAVNGVSTAGYGVDSNNIVHLKGTVKGGASMWDNPIFTLPIGCRPKQNLILDARSWAGNCRIDIYMDGRVAWNNSDGTGNNAQIGLDGISFLAEQ